MIRSFTIRTSGYIGRRRHVAVRVYPDAAGLRAAAHALRPHRDGAGHWDRCWGVFHPTSYVVNADTREGRWPANGFAGTMRLIERAALVNDDGPLPFDEIVAHELVHAAAAIYRMNVARTVNLGAGRGASFEHEEEFAYIYGELAADMHQHLYQFPQANA